MPIFNIFEKGLRRGSEHLPFDPSKAYAYVEHPTEGWRVYLRNVAFLHVDSNPLQIDKFLVFRNSKPGAKKQRAMWEPPKGQMEGKDFKSNGSLLKLMTNALKREVEEEAHVTKIKEIRYTGIVFQSQESTYPPNWFFQYHTFQFILEPETVQEVFDEFQWIEEHPKAFARFRRDRRETDAVAWFDPKKTHLNPRWCPTIVFAYLKTYDQQLIQLVPK
jgi:8-oxo-dGTP pyrophosphatase MutT (NUDIX family)